MNSELIRQIQIHRQQEIDRQERFREEMQRLRRQREETLYHQQQAYLQQQQELRQQNQYQLIHGQQAARSAPTLRPSAMQASVPLAARPRYQTVFDYPGSQPRGPSSHHPGVPAASESRATPPVSFITLPPGLAPRVDGVRTQHPPPT